MKLGPKAIYRQFLGRLIDYEWPAAGSMREAMPIGRGKGARTERAGPIPARMENPAVLDHRRG
jgi:hypothetical protein